MKRELTVFEKDEGHKSTIILCYPTRFEIFTITKWILSLMGYHQTYEYYEEDEARKS